MDQSVNVNQMNRINQRQSNLELFRIIVMLLIIAGHYVSNSGLAVASGPVRMNMMAPRSQFLLQIGGWGKVGINCFVLITGYFMCQSHISPVKFIKLFSQVLFYNVLIGSIFMLTGYEPFSIAKIIKMLLPIRILSDGFVSTFLVFYLCIPFLNVLIHHLNERQHIRLIVFCLLIYVLPATVPGFGITFNYVSWFAVLYFIASFIRFYPKKFYKNQKLWTAAMIGSILASMLSITAFSWISTKINEFVTYQFLIDSNAILAVVTAVCSFMFFHNLPLGSNRIINTISATTFGVLLIHANSDTMRNWLWKDVLDNVYAYSQPWLYLHVLLSVIGVFVICAGIDLLRMKWVEAPYLRWISKKLPAISSRYMKFEDFLYQKFQNS